MKTTILSCLCAFTGLLSSAFGQADTPSPGEADREALRALAARYEQAISQGNLLSLQDAVLDDASAVFITGEKITGLPAMQKYFDEIKKQLGVGSSYTVKLIPDETHFDGDHAIAEGVSEEKVVAGGQEFTYQTRWTAILKRDGATWKAQRLHVSLHPFDNPVIAYRARMQKWTVGAIAAMSGLLLGFFLRKARRS
jgi:ketosteroid isomerase-like protein